MAPPASGTTGLAGVVVPAQLGFLAIYNPSLGTTDETIEDQIVYYYDGGHGGSGSTSGTSDSDVRNERLRQIGLAQGMVAFGRSFAGDQAVDTIETDKTRVVLHELEPGWWLLASVDLTQLSSSSSGTEYSTREVKPTALLLQDLLRAHAVFLLHHAASLAQLYQSTTAAASITTPPLHALLARYWDIFLASWSVLLYGNPVRDVLPGLRMAACGELGIGVGEEDRGSGERAVLEGLVTQTPGLVDLVLCRYGEEEEEDKEEGRDDDDNNNKDEEEAGAGGYPWLGTGSGLGAEDGAVFLGVGAVTRPALRTLTYWLEDIYSWGVDAYGVAESPSSPSTTKTVKRRKKSAAGSASNSSSSSTHKQRQRQQQPERHRSPQSLLPPPPVTQLAARRAKQTTSPPAPVAAKPSAAAGSTESGANAAADGAGIDKYMSYMRLGYGTYWHLGGAGSSGAADEEQRHRQPGTGSPGADVRSDRSSSSAATASRSRKQPRRGAAGSFLIGLTASSTDGTGGISAEVPVRTVVVDMAPAQRTTANERSSQDTIREGTATSDREDAGADADKPGGENNGDLPQRPRTETLRVVVYAQRPFLCACLFRLPATEKLTNAEEQDKQTELLLRRQLGFLHRSLLSSTAYRPDQPGVSALEAVAPGASSGRMYDLVWDPNALTIHSTIPNIPEPGRTGSSSGSGETVSSRKNKTSSKQQQQQQQQMRSAKRPSPPPPAWSRAEAISAHMQILHLYAATRANGAELERMCKTSRGWWIVWNRVVERGGRPVGRRNRQYGGGSGSIEEEDDDDDGNDDDDDSDGAGSVASDDTTRVGAAPSSAMALFQDYAVSKEIFLLRRASDRADRFDRFDSTGGGDQTTLDATAAATAAAAAAANRTVSAPSTVAAAAAAAATAATAATVRVFSPSTYLGLAGRMGSIAGSSGGSESENGGAGGGKDHATPTAATTGTAAPTPARDGKMFTFDGLLSRNR